MGKSFKYTILVGVVVTAPFFAGVSLAQTAPDLTNMVPDITDPTVINAPMVDPVPIDVPEVDLTDLSGFTSLRGLFEDALANQDFNGDGVVGDVTDIASFRELIRDRAENGQLGDGSLRDVMKDVFAEVRANDAFPDTLGAFGGLGGGQLDLSELRGHFAEHFAEHFSGHMHGVDGVDGINFDPGQFAGVRDLLASGNFGGGFGGLGALGGGAEGVAGGFDLSALSGLLGGAGGLGGSGGFDLSALSGLQGGAGGFDFSALSGLTGGLNGGAGGAGGFDLSAILSGIQGRTR